jgi:hypothetical protein
MNRAMILLISNPPEVSPASRMHSQIPERSAYEFADDFLIINSQEGLCPSDFVIPYSGSKSVSQVWGKGYYSDTLPSSPRLLVR